MLAETGTVPAIAANDTLSEIVVTGLRRRAACRETEERSERRGLRS
jgi:hypothetical protein